MILLAGRISWRALVPAACATGLLYVAMRTVFSLVFSAMVISDEHAYGPIGTIFALLSYLIAIGVVVILGAVAGRAWHERSPGPSETGQLPPALPSSAATACALLLHLTDFLAGRRVGLLVFGCEPGGAKRLDLPVRVAVRGHADDGEPGDADWWPGGGERARDGRIGRCGGEPDAGRRGRGVGGPGAAAARRSAP